MNPKVTMVVRILLGLFMLIFGLDKFFSFLTLPPIPGDGGTLMDIYASSGYLKIIGVLETLGGIALISNKYVALALIVTISIMFNAFFIHVLHDDVANVGGAMLGLVLSLVLVYANKSRFSSLLAA